jgi:hypothetical protein
MTTKIPIRASYPSLKTLFFSHLGISVAGPEVLVAEMRKIARSSSITADKKIKVENILGDIDNEIKLVAEEIPRSLGWLRELSLLKIFPVDHPSRGIILCRADDDFYIPDNSGKLQSLFKSLVPMLSVPRRRDIEHIITCKLFKNKLKYLKDFVNEEPIPTGPKQLDGVTARRFSEIAPYLGRYLVFRCSYSEWV